ncbi:unnamed protein product [Moneuplotes crassus]|uniref:EF-hand domain-containing protein n=1 Tax=Euplotes crassus TaxID=5936 RepID=A0AAD1Y0G5_EUPCR|nr:unnamed protein product [Moneuplotes crassus]
MNRGTDNRQGGISQDICSQHFLNFDRNGDGYITTSELGSCLRSLGFHIDESQLKELVDEFDRNHDGKVKFDEFYHVVNIRMQTPLTEEEIKEAFILFDKDNNGKVTAAELKNALMSWGEKLTEDQVNEFIEDADTNGDGELDITELVRILKSQQA